jgi:hypothetical protein
MYMGELVIVQDTLLVQDPMNGKVIQFTADGTYLSTFRMPRTRSTLIGSTKHCGHWYRWTAGRGPATNPALSSDSLHVSCVSRDGEKTSGIPPQGGVWRFGRTLYPFTPDLETAIYRDSVAVLDPVRARVTLIGANGGSRSMDVPAREIDTDQAFRMLERELEVRNASRLLELLRDLPRVDDLPRLSRLLVDDVGAIWVKEYDPLRGSPWTGATPDVPGGIWWVVEPDRDTIRSVRMPMSIYPLHIAEDKLIGKTTDEMGIQRIVVHGIVR